MRMQLQATNSELYSASKRLLEERQPVEGFSNDITGASHRADQRREARWVDLFAQTADVHVDQVGTRVEVIAPDFLEDHHSRQNLPGIAHQEFQQLVFGGQQAQGLIGAAGFAADQVQFQIGHAQGGFEFLDRAFAPQQHFDARRHFIRGERFGEVVITAGTQATHTFVHIGEGADHQDRRRDADGAQGGDDGQAIEFRQHAVEGDQVVIAAHGADQAFAAVVYPIYIQSMATQLGDNLAGRYGVILDGQNSGHGITFTLEDRNRR